MDNYSTIPWSLDVVLYERTPNRVAVSIVLSLFPIRLWPRCVYRKISLAVLRITHGALVLLFMAFRAGG